MPLKKNSEINEDVSPNKSNVSDMKKKKENKDNIKNNSNDENNDITKKEKKINKKTSLKKKKKQQKKDISDTESDSSKKSSKNSSKKSSKNSSKKSSKNSSKKSLKNSSKSNSSESSSNKKVNSTINKDDEKKLRKKYDEILNKHFGYANLKDLQFEIINNIMEGNDVVSLLPTSYGKSICYQMPYLITKKNVIVVSPLISLMEDQTRELNNKNINSICLNSTNKQKAKDIGDIYRGDAKIIYTTPEYLINNSELIDKLAYLDKLALVAIDECHCVSAWGHSFRSDYKKLNIVKDLAPDVPVLALTATATNKVINDVIKNLDLDDPKIIRHSVDRPNLYLEVHHRTSTVIKDDIIPLIKNNKDGKVLIYCKTVSDTDKVTEALKKCDFNCEAYHAQKKSKERTEIQKRYTGDELDIIVSTIAFGMGINIPNIRLMIHYNCSNDVESYLQEIGRAGRDGKLSKCYMFYNGQDFILNSLFLDDIKDKTIKKNKEMDINFLKKYVSTTECRRHCILKYFGEDKNDCQNCDNCLSKRYTRDFTKEAILLFTLMNSFNNYFGMMTYINLLTGSKDKKIEKYISVVKNLYGKGSNFSGDWWKKFIGILMNNGYLAEEKIKGNNYIAIIIKMTPKATTMLNLFKYGDQSKKTNLEFSMPESFKKIDVEIDKENEEDKLNKEAKEIQKKFNIKKVPKAPPKKGKSDKK